MRHYMSIFRGLVGIAVWAGSAASETRIKIGILSDMSGPYSILQVPAAAAARLAVEDFKGADKGIQVEIVSGNHQNKADIGSVIARSWIDQEGVDVIGDVTACRSRWRSARSSRTRTGSS